MENPDPWVTFTVDTFIEIMPFGRQDPYLKFIPGQNDRGATIRIELGQEGGKLFGVIPQFAEMLALQGNNVIIDQVLFDEGPYRMSSI